MSECGTQLLAQHCSVFPTPGRAGNALTDLPLPPKLLRHIPIDSFQDEKKKPMKLALLLRQELKWTYARFLRTLTFYQQKAWLVLIINFKPRHIQLSASRTENHQLWVTEKGMEHFSSYYWESGSVTTATRTLYLSPLEKRHTWWRKPRLVHVYICKANIPSMGAC